ncbi:Nitrate regulatory gene2 protein [Vitis vinifera]|uniref:Nitrate regulatory gene2 protein n=1 Tax=Vitis vinifera TaxID=29760 RepID=A0A438DVM1_VITVI|nr:Nitrate regulatory gene2 protein [Vitis vinifera]
MSQTSTAREPDAHRARTTDGPGAHPRPLPAPARGAPKPCASKPAKKTMGVMPWPDGASDKQPISTQTPMHSTGAQCPVHQEGIAMGAMPCRPPSGWWVVIPAVQSGSGQLHHHQRKNCRASLLNRTPAALRGRERKKRKRISECLGWKHYPLAQGTILYLVDWEGRLAKEGSLAPRTSSMTFVKCSINQPTSSFSKPKAKTEPLLYSVSEHYFPPDLPSSLTKKDEEITKLLHERKSLLLQKQEEEDQDWTKIEKTRSCVESLQSDMIALQQSISRTCSSILKLIDDELYPQLVALTSGLMHMWRTMYECHQVQKHISQQVNHLTNHQIRDSTTDFHRQATAQLETEVTSWYNSFCKLMKSQQEYVRALCRWIQLTERLASDSQQSHCAPVVRTLCEEWQLALDRFPDKVLVWDINCSSHGCIENRKWMDKSKVVLIRSGKQALDWLVSGPVLPEGGCTHEYTLLWISSVFTNDLGVAVASEAIKNLLSAIHSIVLQQAEECNLLKKSEKLERRKRVEDAKAKYLNSVQVSRAMTVNNLQTSLPNVFQALMGFSSVCAQAFEAVHSYAKQAVLS